MHSPFLGYRNVTRGSLQKSIKQTVAVTETRCRPSNYKTEQWHFLKSHISPRHLATPRPRYLLTTYIPELVISQDKLPRRQPAWDLRHFHKRFDKNLAPGNVGRGSVSYLPTCRLVANETFSSQSLSRYWLYGVAAQPDLSQLKLPVSGTSLN